MSQVNACNFTTLGRYNDVMAGTMQHSRASASGHNEHTGVNIVPVFGAPSYPTLTHGQPPSCTGHFTITQAYGANAANCNPRFVERLCSGNVG